MKKNFIFIIAVAFAFCMTVSAAQAGSVSLDPTSQNIAPGDTFFLDVVWDFAGDPTLGGGWDVTFDDTLLNFGSYVWDPVTDAWFSRQDPAFSTDGTTGLLFNFGAGDFDGQAGSGPLTVGRLTFTQAPSVVPPDSTIISIGPTTGSAGPFVSATTFVAYDPQPDFISANVNIVPIPGSILLLGSGVLGLVGLSRRKRS